ncbi:GAF domain-containing protein [Actinoplanes sp. M2I2]|uniref:GAF domain-containing protein n=1 Tax=Actinoplanes sp. M2I2 TaxID=1734444 RepID=UPI002020BB42|nr:GAF domain-containing protein [Actinoplanes sp. M2I2]
MTQQRPTPPVPQSRSRLSGTLVLLAGTPDDHSSIESQLVTIAKLSAQRVEPVSYASVTTRRGNAYTTVAASNDIALAVDEAQYADRTGPCLDALETAKPYGVADIAETMRWPGFRDTAYRLGLHTSLSIPLFAGRGEPVAALNLYGHDSIAMTVLTSAVWATYDEAAPGLSDHPGLDPGGDELVDGLSDAFAVRAIIQQAIGIIVATDHGTRDLAYATLRLRAADTGSPLPIVAQAVITDRR